MYELTVAFQYLLPKWRQLSVSIIGLISIAVIALVVWLIVVFFSVTHGLEKTWLQKLVAITAPARLTPTPAYYQSYYYLIDGSSANSNYTLKSIGEKLEAADGDPYDPEYDSELPSDWPKVDMASDGTIKDLVKEAFAAIQAISSAYGLEAYEYEVSKATLHLPFIKPEDAQEGGYLSQDMLIGALEAKNPAIIDALLPLGSSDVDKILQNLTPKHPSSPHSSDGIVLPKSFSDAGVRIGDRGWLAYSALTSTAVQEQRLPVHVAGFYDPGIIPIGGKFLLGGRHLPAMIRAAQHHEDVGASNGIQIAFDDLAQVDDIKNKLTKELEKRGIAPYWQLETFRDYPYARDLLQQLHSERNLFSFLAAVIIAVACSNIVSMLIILVNDKRQEIGILRAMGATAFSIAAIFGLCGAIMGLLGSLIGIAIALVTLRYLQTLIDLLSALQGHELFNPIFYGGKLPSMVSGEALLFVIVATGALSLLSGIVPALKAALVRPTELLRND